MNTDLIEILRTNIGVPENLLDPATSLDAAGVDSLAVVELSLLLCDKLDITVADADIARAATLGDINGLVCTELDGRATR